MLYVKTNVKNPNVGNPVMFDQVCSSFHVSFVSVIIIIIIIIIVIIIIIIIIIILIISRVDRIWPS